MPRLALLAAPAVLANFSLPSSKKYSRGGSSPREENDPPQLYFSVSSDSAPPPLPLRSFSALFGFHPCFPLSTLANIARINRRATKWRRERCRPTTRAFSANYQSPSLPKWLDKDCNGRKRTRRRMDARVSRAISDDWYFFVCQFRAAVYFVNAIRYCVRASQT